MTAMSEGSQLTGIRPYPFLPVVRYQFYHATVPYSQISFFIENAARRLQKLLYNAFNVENFSSQYSENSLMAGEVLKLKPGVLEP